MLSICRKFNPETMNLYIFYNFASRACIWYDDRLPGGIIIGLQALRAAKPSPDLLVS